MHSSRVPGRRRRFARHGRLAIAPAGFGALLSAAVWAAGPAAAHVTVSSPDAAAGGYGKVVVRVPDESATASTVAVQLALPQDVAFASVSVKPHPGWSVRTQQRALPTPVSQDGFTLSKTVSTITWTAPPGRGIAPGQFDEFEVSLGPFPKAATTLSFAATQTYSDGTVVRWDQPRTGGAEPAHPAPTLRLAQPAAQPSPEGGAAGASPSTTASDITVATARTTSSQERWALGLSVVAVVLAAASLGVSVRRGRAVPA